ncbi:hypothetical protein KIW84_051251 [Lathyrus oleraceus]|uniref:Uncharacterized protein n=1 Tax=Pisum sativum TaxID=3888 RepID=A0A9D5ADC6_PEA|nr:hypothetical protein KIW84_051251 [Pisum sativum]
MLASRTEPLLLLTGIQDADEGAPVNTFAEAADVNDVDEISYPESIRRTSSVSNGIAGRDTIVDRLALTLLLTEIMLPTTTALGAGLTERISLISDCSFAIVSAAVSPNSGGIDGLLPEELQSRIQSAFESVAKDVDVGQILKDIKRALEDAHGTSIQDSAAVIPLDVQPTDIPCDKKDNS